MAICPTCGLSLTIGDLCNHHSAAMGDGWAESNRIWCEVFHGANTNICAGSLAWLAGILEGEGCFTAERHSTKYENRYLRITLAMTDGDVVRRAAELLGVRVMGPYQRKALNTKPIYRCVVIGRKAEAWMRALRPLMGMRRGAKIDELLAGWGEGAKPGCHVPERLSADERDEEFWASVDTSSAPPDVAA